MRSMTAELAGRHIDLAATFGAAREMSQKVGDPIAIAREAQLEAAMGAAGMVYHPKWVFTVENVPAVLHIGAKAAGSKMTLAEMQDVVMEAGFLEAKAVALEYIALIITPKAQEQVESDKEAKPGE